MTELRIENLPLPAAKLGSENPFPVFRDPSDDLTPSAESIAASVAAEDRRWLGWRCAYRVLPYRMQDDYSRDRQIRPFRVAVLENEHLRATVAPEIGGRMLSLFDKDVNRELLFRNPVFQPANLALRNAWFNGGVEFNAGQYGHHYLTCSPVFAARIRGSRGEPALRIYEWDRVKCFPYQVDFHLPPDSRFLFLHVRLVNPNDHELPMYWWTNIAVSENERTRVLCPADTAFDHVDGKLTVTPVPCQTSGLDITYARNLPAAHEHYFIIPAGQRPWEAAVEADGTGVLQVSTPRLRGRKVFCWGMNQGGRQWQDFLSLPGHPFLEIQGGLARTQAQHLPMPPGATWEWTEALGGVAVDPRRAHSSNWYDARNCIEAVLAARIPEEFLEKLDRDFAQTATRRGDETITSGSGWAALERRRLAVQRLPDRIPPELDFGAPGEDQRPWMALLEKGIFPSADSPGHLMVQPEWQDLLEQSLKDGRGDHWLAWWHLGNMRLENRDSQGAKKAWETSRARRNTAWVLRNLAVLATRTANAATPSAKPVPPAEACELIVHAWEAGPRIAQLAIEIAQTLLSAGQYARLAEFIGNLPEHIRHNERINIFAAMAALQLGNLDEVAPLFQQKTFTSIREGELTLTDIWFGYHERRLANGQPVDDALRARVRKEYPPPKHIDFRNIT